MAFVYRAISFPFRRGPTEFPQSAIDNDLIKQSLVQIVMTGRGERVMRPSVGTNVVAYLFENVGPELEGTIRREIAGAIAAFEPRVRVQAIKLTTTDTTVDVLIAYTVIATNQNQTLQLALGQL